MKKQAVFAHSQRAARVRGVSLVEIMVAVLVLSFGLLGLMAVQTRALRANISALQRTQAIMLSQSMLDLMRVDRNKAALDLYDMEWKCQVNEITNGHPLANSSLRAWLAELKNSMGNDGTTCAMVDCSYDYRCSVQVQWNDGPAGGLENQTISLTSRL